MFIDLAKMNFIPAQGGQAGGGKGTWYSPYSVKEAVKLGASSEKIYVVGKVVRIWTNENYSGQYGNARYEICDLDDDVYDSDVKMTVYRGNYFFNKKAYEFPSFCIKDIQLLDIVIVAGTTNVYQGNLQFPQNGSELYLLNGWSPNCEDTTNIISITENNPDLNIAYYARAVVEVAPDV